ncbi:hypothetical protein BDV96DRAFT_643309 [Lophiotrema nucula]|uniref:2EXR domain-containing protein n=1 Tax=Lophiotrema nucula TaxID=690887 RepID=A0A6A5ZI42_9PLEO|nr:hypothetical protein BDV96DRAFT_643309 [Lophiotrema nucula]
MPHQRTASIRSPPHKRVKSSEERPELGQYRSHPAPTMPATVTTTATTKPTECGEVLDRTTVGILYSTGVDLTSFHRFSELDKNLRLKIWALAAHPPRTHFIEIYHYTAAVYNISARLRYVPPLPSVFSATSESRQAVISAQGGEVISLVTRPHRTEFYLNFQHDILFLSSRFASGLHASETYRLREMESLVPYPHLARLRRIVVTYSGVDDYSRIAFSMRWLKQLETLYVAMMDWWSKRTVTRLLRKGVPGQGTVAMKIERNLADLEGEETDDDSDKEEFGDSSVTKRNVRVVEVELRLEEGEKKCH